MWGESLFTVCFSVLLCFHRQLFSSSVLGSSFLSLLPPRFFSGPGTLVMLSNRDDQPPLKPHPKPSPPPPPLQLSHQPLPTTIILCTSNCSLSSISHPSFTLLRPSPNAYILSSARQYWILPVPLWDSLLAQFSSPHSVHLLCCTVCNQPGSPWVHNPLHPKPIHPGIMIHLTTVC